MAITGVPRVPSGVLVRPRLIARFDGPEAIVLAHAPAGYGKSIAMAQWASTTQAQGIWLRIRDGNAGSAAFVQHLAAEMGAACMLHAAHPLRFALEALAGGADPWLLLRRGLVSSPGALTVAIDGMDRLDAECIDGLAQLVQDLPGFNIRATARRRGAMNEPALAIKLDVSIVGVSELSLTATEVAQALSLDIGSPTVASVVASGGLPLVMRLAGQDLGNDAVAGAGAGESMSHVVDSVIDAEIISGAWAPGFVRFVAATSIAESLDLPLALDLAVAAGLVTARDPSAEAEIAGLLRLAEAEGLGLWAGTSRSPETFSYTPLIREAFERRIRIEQPQLLEDLVLAAAEWELSNGQPYLALRRAVQQRHWDLASRVVRTYWNELLRNHGPQLRRLFHGVPLGVLRRHPLITMLLALEFNRTGHHRIRALEYFALASYGARTQRDRSALADRVVLRAIEAAALRVSGRVDGALAAALDGRATLLAMSPEERDGLGRVEPTLHNQFGTTFFYAGRHEAALDEFARSAAVGASRGLKAGLQGMALSSGALAIAGDLKDARSMMAEASALEWPDGWLTGYMGSFYQVAAAFLALESWDPDEADRHIRTLDPHRETIEHWPVLAHVDAIVALLRGDPHRARLKLDAEILTQRRRRAISPQTIARLGHTRSLIEIAAGRLDAAEKALGKTPSARRNAGLARIALARAQPEEALRLLMKSTEAAGDPPSSRARAEALALRSGALALMRDVDRSAQSVRELLQLLEDRQQGLALATVPTDALDAMIDIARRTGVADPLDLLTRARSRSLVTSSSPVPTFTQREIALARVLPQAHRTVDIAAALSVSPNTVKTQLRGLYRKLGVANRSEAISALSVMSFGDASTAVPDHAPEPHPFDSGPA